eukprot:SAG11_NODE_1636_length_4537_cov_2.667868_3_plen_156_part_00
MDAAGVAAVEGRVDQPEFGRRLDRLPADPEVAAARRGAIAVEVERRAGERRVDAAEPDQHAARLVAQRHVLQKLGPLGQHARLAEARAAVASAGLRGEAVRGGLPAGARAGAVSCEPPPAPNRAAASTLTRVGVGALEWRRGAPRLAEIAAPRMA